MDPFPPEATARLRDLAREVSRDHKVELPPGEVALPQPVDVLLLGSLLKAFGDPDSEVMVAYARGVPLGVGVDLPRTPDVFPPKLKWALKEQEAHSGSATSAEDFKGVTRANYSSAVGHAGGSRKGAKEARDPGAG